MKWFNNAVFGVLAANKLGFGLALAEICQTWDREGPKHSLIEH
jgi:hypothetical protein